MSDKPSWRHRMLREAGRVPSLTEGFLPSLRVYLRGGGQEAGYGSLLGDLAELRSPYGYRRVIPADIEKMLADGLLVTNNVHLREVLWATTDEDAPREQVFDMIQAIDAMLRDLSPDSLHPQFVEAVNGLFDREHQPYQLRDGSVVDRHTEEEWAILEGLEALAPDNDLREIIRSARADFFNPREDRKQAALRAIALAFDGAKTRLAADPKEAFEIVKADALHIPAVADAEKTGEAWTHLFDDLNKIAHQMIRHAAPDRPTPKTAATTEFLFFALAAAVRLLLSTRQTREAEAPSP